MLRVPGRPAPSCQVFDDQNTFFVSELKAKAAVNAVCSMVDDAEDRFWCSVVSLEKQKRDAENAVHRRRSRKRNAQKCRASAADIVVIQS